MTLDKFGRHIQHHDDQLDEVYLVKDVTDIRTDFNNEIERKLSQLRCVSISTFSLHPSTDDSYFMRFHNAQTFLRLFHTGRIRLLMLEGWKADMHYFLNRKMFTTLEALYEEPITSTSCIQIRGTLNSPISGYAVVEYTPWFEGTNPFVAVARQVLEPYEAAILMSGGKLSQ